MNWNKFDEVGPPEKNKPCLVYKPNNPYCKYWVDEWADLYESPVSWSSATICVGEGWADEDDMDNITHWCYCTEPTELGKSCEEPEDEVSSDTEIVFNKRKQSDDPNDLYPQQPWAW